MDKQTTEFLNKLKPSREVMKKMYKEVTPMKAEKEKMQEVLESRVTSDKDKKVIKGILKTSGDQYDRKTLILNEKVAAEENKRMETKIKDAIARGDLKPFDPKKDKQAQKWLKKTQR